MDAKLKQFLGAAESLGPSKAGRKFPKKLRELGATYAAERRAAGATWQVIAGELGVSTLTLQRWCELRGGTPGRFEQVAVVEDRQRGAYTATIGALRIENLDFEAIVALARALS